MQKLSFGECILLIIPISVVVIGLIAAFIFFGNVIFADKFFEIIFGVFTNLLLIGIVYILGRTK